MRLSLFALLPVLFVVSCSSPSHQVDDIRQEFDSVGYLKMKGLFCEVEVEAWDGETVVLEGQLLGNTSEGSFDIQHKQTDSTLKVWLETPFASLGSVRGKLHVKVPRTTKLKVTNTSGDIYVEGLAGEKVKLKTESGEIQTNDIQTRLSAKTTSGDIQIVDNTGNVKAKTASGDVQLINIEGNVKGTATSGDLNLNSVTGVLRIETGSGDVKGNRIKLTGPSNVTTSSGNIRLRFDNPMEELGFNLIGKAGNITVGDSLTRESYQDDSGTILFTGSTNQGDQVYK